MNQFEVAWYLLLLVLAQVNSESNIIEGLCDWTVQSGERTIPASVHTVRFYACQSGQVNWLVPYGGVQIMFKTGVPQGTEGEYKVCITSANNGFDIFTRNKDNLKLLRSQNAKNIRSEICVSSQTKQVMIYMESGKDMTLDKAVFTYRAMFLGNGHGSLRPKDCKICSRKELIKSFCTGDFAIHGNVKSVSSIGGSENRGEAVVVVKKIFHQSANIFQKSSDASEILGNVNFPLYCHWKKGVKDGYLYTGNIKDKQGPVVHCRIKFKLWKRLYHKNICDSVITQT